MLPDTSILALMIRPILLDSSLETHTLVPNSFLNSLLQAVAGVALGGDGERGVRQQHPPRPFLHPPALRLPPQVQ